jgi:hypothetical protein
VPRQDRRRRRLDALDEPRRPPHLVARRNQRRGARVRETLQEFRGSLVRDLEHTARTLTRQAQKAEQRARTCREEAERCMALANQARLAERTSS